MRRCSRDSVLATLIFIILCVVGFGVKRFQIVSVRYHVFKF